MRYFRNENKVLSSQSPRLIHVQMVVLLIFLAAVEEVQAFTANLARPWDETSTISKRRHSTGIKFYVSQVKKANKSSGDNNNNESESNSRKDDDINEGGKDNDEENEDVNDDINMEQEDEEDMSLADTEDIPGSSSHGLESGTTAVAAASVTSGGSYSSTPAAAVSVQQTQSTTDISNNNNDKSSVKKSLKELIAMTRPSNLPGVVLFHMLGTFLTTRSTGWELLKILFAPPMIVTLVALLLTSATSMLVNDYYDYKLGNDSSKRSKPLTSHKVSLATTKRFLSYLYSAALFCVAAIPGTTARLSVVTGLMLTFWYTQHLKPRTWLKNFVCASLIALSPLTSGAAAVSYTNTSWYNLLPLLRVTAMLFVGILGREITMDINDVVDDMDHGVRTVPVVYGRKFACTVGLLCTLGVAGFAMSGPILDFLPALLQQKLSVVSISSLRRLIMATVGSLALIRRALQVLLSDGLDPSIVNRAVDEGLLTVVFLLASFL